MFVDPEPRSTATERLIHRALVGAQALAVGTLLLAAVLARTGAAAHPVVVGINTFAFHALWPLAGLALVGLVTRRLRRTWPSLLGLLLFVLSYGAQFLPWRALSSDRGFAVMTWNVQRTQRGVDELLATIVAADAELLALQEVDPPEPSRSDLLSRLEDHGYECVQVPYRKGTAGGVAACAKGPFRILRALRRTYHAEGRWSYLFAELETEGGRRFNLVVPHLLSFHLPAGSLPSWAHVRRATSWHEQEAGALLELVDGLRDPTVIAGDFNSTPEQGVHVKLRRGLQDAFAMEGFGLGGTRTYVLPLRIDYVYASEDFEIHDARTGPAGPSDHRCVIARLGLRGVP